ncbi:hypothetical protein BOM_0865 [Borrelia miyamotoi FR64b]|nr:hypothetical protein BOM_0865 [Borrelia miyamotoi FR64b]
MTNFENFLSRVSTILFIESLYSTIGMGLKFLIFIGSSYSPASFIFLASTNKVIRSRSKYFESFLLILTVSNILLNSRAFPSVTSSSNKILIFFLL